MVTSPKVTALLDGGPLADIEAGLRERLVAVFPERVFEHQVLPPHLTGEAWREFTRHPPTIGLGLSKVTPAKDLGRQFRGTSHWQVLLVVRNSSLPLLMRGDAQRAGIFGMLSTATVALHGFVIANHGSAQLGEGGPVYSDQWASQELAVAGLSVAVDFNGFDQAQLVEFAEFLRLGVTWEGKEALPPEVDVVRDGP